MWQVPIQCDFDDRSRPFLARGEHLVAPVDGALRISLPRQELWWCAHGVPYDGRFELIRGRKLKPYNPYVGSI